MSDLSKQSVDKDWFLLTEPINSKYRLNVM